MISIEIDLEHERDQEEVPNLTLEESEEMNRRSMELYAQNIDAWRSKKYAEPVTQINYFLEFIPGEKRVLDVGCGWGASANQFLQGGCTYTGIDLSKEMVEIARNENPRATFLVMSYRSLTFPDNSFDGVFCCCSLEYEPKRNIGNVLQELKRVLVPGGCLYVLTPAGGSDEWIHEDEETERRTYRSIYSPREFLKKLKDAGFVDIDEAHFFESGALGFMAKKAP